MGFSLKFNKTYKNPVKTKSTTSNEFDKHTKSCANNGPNSAIDSFCVTEFDGKPLQRTEQSKPKLEAVIESQPNSNKLYERLRQLEVEPIDKTTNLVPPNKVYTHEDYLHEIKTLPSMSKMADYKHMPIGDFGKAMLRGMGWNEGTPIGLTNKGLVEPIEYIPRTKGLGLGAQSRSEFLNDTKHDSTSKSSTSKKSTYRYISEGSKKLEKERVLEYGLIKFGEWKDSYVRIVKHVSDSNCCIVQFINDRDKIETINSKYITKVPKDEALTNSTCSKNSSSTRLKNWLLPHLYVRIVSKSFKGGEFYGHKAQVINVGSDKRNKIHCDLITDESVKLKDVSEAHLQTVIPKNEDGLVVVLCGEHQNKRGHVVSIQNDTASVHFQDDDLLRPLSLDHICQIFPR